MRVLNLTEELLFHRHDMQLPLYRYKGNLITRKRMIQSVSELSSQLCHYIEPGDQVVLYLNDSPSLVCAFLSTIACGGIPSVVNPMTKHEGLQHVIQLTDAKLIFTSIDKATYIPHDCQFEVLFAEDDHQVDISDFSLGEGNPDWRDFVRTPGTDTSYLQFTSGSTGLPKAVRHSAEATLSFCRNVACSWLGLSSADVIYSVPKMFFGYGMGNSLFFPLFTGASAVLDCEWPKLNSIVSHLNESRPTVLFGGPAIFNLLRPRAKDVASIIRTAVSAGSVLSREEADYWAELGVHIKNGFGATELGHVFLASVNEAHRGSLLTRMLDGYEYRLIDKSGQKIQTPHMAGVLLIRGPSLSSGYLKQEQVTAEKFCDGWYRTGDLFELDEHGSFCYLGREDDLFKVNGRWIVPAVIELSVCEAFPEIQEAVLVPSSRVRDTLRATLFVVTRTGEIDEAAMKHYIRVKHESYMAPGAVIALHEMPRNANGKLNRQSLIDLAEENDLEVREAIRCS
ncbi:AMP-binding protein [Photobacterium sp. 1_MG-2023]|uniref:AMP-binding protein n=1 Tax=Photobacterium sp. 1_MG-2023 TaxID=3062646 RepID=UPI0026E22196|nr:AMP-binding protein [Photobacterium sp. 1_MG-2023]MDO6708157.1 AMP-binding protein [Photobacterium sp. 1_MG-2023]